MVALFLTTTISCSQAISLIQRIQRVVGLSETQRSEVVSEIRKVVPSCPVKVIKDEKRISNSSN